MTAGDAEFNLLAASIVNLNGSAEDIVVEVSSASTADFGDFPVRNADVTVSGASKATVNLDGILDADLSGASTLEYMGDPTLGDIDISGASSFRKK